MQCKELAGIALSGIGQVISLTKLATLIICPCVGNFKWLEMKGLKESQFQKKLTCSHDLNN